MPDEALIMVKYDSHDKIPRASYFAFVNDPNCPNDAPPERDLVCRGWVSLSS